MAIFFFAAIAVTGIYYFRGYWRPVITGPGGEEQGPEAVIENYGPEIKKYAKEFRISPEFMAALCMMESGGRKPVPFRFEKHVYTRLKLVQLHARGSYEHVKPENLNNAGDEALQNLASSWGPFQLMGYKCMLFGIKVRDLRGDDGVKWAAKWMDTTYGRYLRKNDYKSAFHIHNAGIPFPKDGASRTFNKKYVDEGLKWMAYFKGKI